MRIKTSKGDLYVNDDHPLLKSRFRWVDFRKPVGMDHDFLDFLFNGNTKTPLHHAKMAYHGGYDIISRETFLSHLDEIDIVTEEMKCLFTWDELPDRLAVQVLENPSEEDFCKIVKLEYHQCYDKFAGQMKKEEYFRDLSFSFLDKVISTKGIHKCLHIACSNGNLEMIRHLMKLGADINFKSGKSLVLAVKNGHLNIVTFLLQQKVNARCFCDEPLMLAIEIGRLDIVKCLVEYGVDPKTIPYGVALNMAITEGQLEILKYLISSCGMNPVFEYEIPTARWYGRDDIVEYLVALKKKAKAQMVNNALSSPKDYPH